jgi:hypothetical protein
MSLLLFQNTCALRDSPASRGPRLPTVGFACPVLRVRSQSEHQQVYYIAEQAPMQARKAIAAGSNRPFAGRYIIIRPWPVGRCQPVEVGVRARTPVAGGRKSGLSRNLGPREKPCLCAPAQSRFTVGCWVPTASRAAWASPASRVEGHRLRPVWAFASSVRRWAQGLRVSVPAGGRHRPARNGPAFAAATRHVPLLGALRPPVPGHLGRPGLDACHGETPSRAGR